MSNLQGILTEIIRENSEQIMFFIKDEKGKIIACSDNVNQKEMCRYPSEDYYKYDSKIWALKELTLDYQNQKVTVQMYINITSDIKEREQLKKDHESGLILEEYFENILHKLVKKTKSTSKGVTIIAFEFDEEILEDFNTITVNNIIKDLGDCIIDNISKKDYGFRLAKNSFVILLNNSNSNTVGTNKADLIKTLAESKTYQAKSSAKKQYSYPIVYYGIATIGTTRIPNNDPIALLDLAKENLENQKQQRKETRAFLENDKEENIILS